MTLRRTIRLLSLSGAATFMALAVIACGSSSKPNTTPATSASVAPPATTTTTAPAPAHLSISSPRARSHTAQTFAVRVVLTGGGGVAGQFNYLLDGHLVRVGSARVTFHHVTPGHHRLQVVLVATPAVNATTTFTVRAPKVVVSVAPVVTTPAVTPTVSTPTPTPTPAPKPKPKPTPTPTPAPKSGGGIPQGGAGDGDADNSGGPSDGDGNL